MDRLEFYAQCFPAFGAEVHLFGKESTSVLLDNIKQSLPLISLEATNWRLLNEIYSCRNFKLLMFKLYHYDSVLCLKVLLHLLDTASTHELSQEESCILRLHKISKRSLDEADCKKPYHD